MQWGAGLHVAEGQRVNASAYEQWVGRWSRLFVPTVLKAAEVAAGDRVLDVATGPGEAAALALSRVGPTGLVIGVDIAPAMLDTARARFAGQRFRAAAMDGQALALPDASFDCVICQLGLMFFPIRPEAWQSSVESCAAADAPLCASSQRPNARRCGASSPTPSAAIFLIIGTFFISPSSWPILVASRACCMP